MTASLSIVPRAHTVGPSGSQVVFPRLRASRTSGPAPLSVMFDAIDTTHANPAIDTWRELGYSFDFGSAITGTWEHSGQPKRYQRGGPLALCVFETPGTYVVKCRARDANGNAAQDSITITVTDPDSVFAGTATVCLSRTSDHTGAPAGAQLISNATSWPTVTNGRRYLCHRDQDFRSLGGWTATLRQDLQLGAYSGSGARPLLSGVTIDSANPRSLPSTDWSQRIVLSDLDIPSGSYNNSISSKHVLILRTRFNGGSSRACAIGLDSNFYANASDLALPIRQAIEYVQNTHLVESTFTGGSAETCGVFGVGRSICIVGCEVDPILEHCIRLSLNTRALVSHNYLHGVGDSARGLIKWNSGGLQDYNDFVLQANNAASRYCIASYNHCGSPTEPNPDLAIGASPQNADEQEGLEDFIYEGNTFYRRYNLAEIAFVGRRMTARGNVMDSSVGGVVNHITTQTASTPPAWKGPYFVGLPAIVTEDPV